MAGESAREVARRKREKIARLTRQAEAYEKGAVGESRTADVLAGLPSDHWTVLHDVTWPGRLRANIDHVAIGPSGVFVIDSKNWSGTVEVRDGVLRQNGYRREREVAGAADAALAVSELLGALGASVVRPVICCTSSTGLRTHSREVTVCSADTLVQELVLRPPVLAPPTAGRVTAALRSGLRPHQAPRAGRLGSPSPRPPAIGRPPAVVRPPSPPRRSRGGRAWLVAILGLIFALGGIALAYAVITGVVRGMAHPSPGSGVTTEGLALGTAADLPRATGRPPLSITPDRFAAVRVREGAALIDGNRWVGVHVIIADGGQRPWHSQPGTLWQLTDDLGTPWRPQSDVTIPGKRVLPDAISVAPGQQVEGWLVFQVRANDSIVGLGVKVGPGAPASTTWTIDRQ